MKMKENNPNTERNKIKKYFDPKFKPDIVPEQRSNVIRNFDNYYAPDMLKYYYSKKERIRTWTPEIYEEIEELMINKENTLLGKGRIDKDIYFKYWILIERSGEELDEFGMVKEKINFEERLKEIEDNYSHIGWNTLFKLDWELFGDGTNNIVCGGMGTGKSNLILSLALACMERSNRYELVTNLGIKRGNDFDDIHIVSWMSELLRLICENKIKNIELEKQGKGHLEKTIIFVIDEAENLFQSIRSGSKEIADWNLIVNMFRKLQVSATYIFHRYKDVPAQIRTSPNINAIILKGCDIEDNPINEPIDRVKIFFPKYNAYVRMKDIPECPLLDTREISSFGINEEEFPEKSVNIKYVLRLASQTDMNLAPGVIMDYLDRVKLENISKDELLKEVRRISDVNKDYMILADTKTDYFQWIQKKFQDAFQIDDITEVKGVTQTIKKVVNEDWSITRIRRKEEEIKEIKIDYRTAPLNDLFKYLQTATLKQLKLEVQEGGLRNYLFEEYVQLETFGISRGKLQTIYGQIKAIVQTSKQK